MIQKPIVPFLSPLQTLPSLQVSLISNGPEDLEMSENGSIVPENLFPGLQSDNLPTSPRLASRGNVIQPNSPKVPTVPIEHISQIPGNLITSGNVISAITKYLSEWSNKTDKISTDTELFKEIEQRTMTDKERAHYKRVLHEMTETERIHLKGLEILEEVYLTPLTKSTVPETVNFVKPIVSQINLLLGAHQKFLSMMEKGENVPEGELPIIGADFVKNIQFLKMAATYISKYSTYLMGITDILNKEKDVVRNQNKAKAEYLRVHEGSKVEMISFYLITPIQRIPRYELLIRDMLKDVGKDFPDVEQLKKAYLQAKECGRGVNQTRMQIEEGEKMTLVKNAIDNFPQLENVSSRKFICCGPLIALDNMNDPPVKTVFVFLFNDLLIVTKVKKFNDNDINETDAYDANLFKEISEIKTIEDISKAHFEFSRIVFFQKGSKMMPLSDNSIVKNVFMFMAYEEMKNSSEKKGMYVLLKFSAITPEQKESWKSVINDQISCIKEREEKLKKAQEKIQNTTEVIKVDKIPSKLFDRSCSKYLPQSVGKLVTSSGTINSVLKLLHDTFNNSQSLQKEVLDLFEIVDKKEMDKDEVKRFRAIFVDLCNNETSHLWVLKTLKEVYLPALSKSVNKEQNVYVTDALTQINVMTDIHKDLLVLFTKAKRKTEDKKIPLVMEDILKKIQFMKTELTYIGNCHIYTKLFEEVSKNPIVEKAIQKAKETFLDNIKYKTPIESMNECLMKPVHQLMSYELFMKALLKHSWNNYEELNELKRVYLDARQCHKDALKTKTQLEEKEKTQTILDLFETPLNLDNEQNDSEEHEIRFKCSGPLFIVENLNETPKNWKYFFLFNDRLVMSEVVSYNNLPIIDLVDVFGKLRVAKSVDDLKMFKFQIVKEFTFNADVTLEVHPVDKMCKFIILLKVLQVPYRLSCSTESEFDVWNSIIFDQIEKIKNGDVNEEPETLAMCFACLAKGSQKNPHSPIRIDSSPRRVTEVLSPRRARSEDPHEKFDLLMEKPKFVKRLPTQATGQERVFFNKRVGRPSSQSYQVDNEELKED
ncbi:Rho/RAC guanine nucleotide exchange factor, putative [Entamoeba invadens IP1]|uniref:Rho/RAC guanine nucleotide exchange factor, putative n=1 Tax=Entamoeba invadens IP1 TaxID=370355 RepID=A0A0A1TU74_ENTIV|nr:Rho/RAC guanine nucleotide exchange factor, putative [Entamoeba invadens IP1]ELP83475.1 Rho/RAC guanine nucleotide exchange factor, putative [Entamoeba invadens IP1]|eukprot:XP_004182821.1 Rho/RAC guanine nucleotide exchange factor, putative [Entamoeba invadens IP1]